MGGGETPKRLAKSLPDYLDDKVTGAFAKYPEWLVAEGRSRYYAKIKYRSLKVVRDHEQESRA
jgi:hypothetical protein